MAAVYAVLGFATNSSQRMQSQLSTDMAGLQVVSPTMLVPLARAADLIESGPVLREAVVPWLSDGLTASAVDGVDSAVDAGLLEDLAAWG